MNPSDLEGVLPDYRRWLYREARQLLFADGVEHPLVDDLVQEGYIALWRALGTYDPSRGALPAWLTMQARSRMLDARRSRHWTTSDQPKAGTRNQSAGFTQDRGDVSRARIQQVIDDHRREHGTRPSGVHIAKKLGMSKAAVSYQVKKMPTVAAANAVRADDVSLDALVDDVGFDVPWADVDALHDVEVAYHAGEVAQALDRLTPAQRRYVNLRFWQQATPTELREAFGYDPKGLWPPARSALESSLGHLRELVDA